MAKVTTLSFQESKQRGEKITVLTAYDFPTAQALDGAGVDALLVGDSMAMAVMGLRDTLSVTVDDILHHTRMVSRAAARAMVIADMPFLSYNITPEESVRNAGRLIAEGGAQAVKVEGPVSRIGASLERILAAGIPVMGHLGLTPQSVHQFGGFKVQGKDESARARLKADALALEAAGCYAIVLEGIPVMGHLGLTPQSVHQFGGFKVQGKDEAARARLKADALALEAAGCFSIVLECIPADLGAEISSSLRIPTIGIGAGSGCDGQVLVIHDILGWGKARFAHTFVDVKSQIGEAATRYVDSVKSGAYPAPEHTYP